MRRIEVIDYDPTWPDMFAAERRLVAQALGEAASHIEHIGSTSVPGLAAKPVIDMLVQGPSLTALARHDAAMIEAGYEPLGAYGIEGRLFYRKGGDDRTHHVHAFETGSEGAVRHLAFRDYLRAHPDVAAAYAAVKRDAARGCDHDIDRYGDLKGPFIREHEARALRWYAR